MKPVIHASTDPAITERETVHCALARKICADGIVLLENNGILPLNADKVALYGAGARHTVFGGTGSGENNPRYNINVEEGLKNSGITVTSGAWLDEYDVLFENEYTTYKRALSKAIKKVPIAQRMDYSADNPFYLPSGRELSDDDDLSSDTAVYVLARQSGEGSDRKDIPGDYYITEGEKALMQSVTKYYRNTVLVINTGAVIDLKFLDEISFSAVVLLMQGGMETGNALADVLTGKVCPSGRLADTWADSYSDYPSAGSFSSRSTEKYQEDYREGIFVGYRWFDKKKIRPRYPFGYGLSYTGFVTEYKSAEVSGTKIRVNAVVTNTGKVPGRETVMLFLTCPEERLIREERSLAAFTKTDLIGPGGSETVSLVFDLKDHAGFDTESSSFILEQGDYFLSLNNTPVCILRLDEEAVTEKCKPLFTSDREIDRIIFEKRKQITNPGLPAIKIGTSVIKTVTHDYKEPDIIRSEKIDEIVSKLTVRDMAGLITGRSYFGPFRHRVFGAVGYTTSKLFRKGIDAMPMADGPQGINLTRISGKPLHNIFAIPTMPSAIRDTHRISRTGIADDDTKKLRYYQFCTSWPSETLVAQTWDVKLARELGDAVGKEMLEYGVVFWLAPALNIHRNPLCGRNYEYYSEDPMLTGMIASAVTEGVQSHHGCYVTLKHFAANNLETGRNKSSSNLDERTLREIYLKAFRIAISGADAAAVMCSYNKINGTYTALDRNLQTCVLRNEWGFRGIVMTDWFATGHDESLDELCCTAGTDLIMPGHPLIPSKIMKAYRKGLITKEDIERSARRIIRLALESHLSNS